MRQNYSFAPAKAGVQRPGSQQAAWGLLARTKALKNFSFCLCCSESGQVAAIEVSRDIPYIVLTYTTELVPSLKPVITTRENMHKVTSEGTTRVLSVRGPWIDRWKAY
jgi:hypothetical protein